MTTNIKSVCDALVQQGIDTLFGLMGNGNLDLIVDLVDRHNVRYVGVRHENAAIAAADGFARASGRIGVGTVTHGPGLTNCLTAIVTACRARSPMLVVTGNASGYPGRSSQRLDHRVALEALGVPVISPGPADDWGHAAIQALRMAATDTVVLDLPAEAFRYPATIGDRSDLALSPLVEGPPTDPEAAAQVAALLKASTRPLIIAGRGAMRAGVKDQLIELGALFGARLGTSLAAKGLFNGADGDIGIIGGLATPLSLDVCRSCDVALVVGASLNGFTTENGSLLNAAKVIRLDEAPNLAATIVVHTALTGDVAQMLADIRAAADNVAAPRWSNFEPLAGRTEVLSWPDQVFVRLDRDLPEARAVVFDHGAMANRAIPFFQVTDPSQSIFMADFGSIGLSVAAAIGAAIARPDRRTMVVVGDGALMMSLAELDTLKRIGAPVLVVVFNDGVYGAEYPHLEAMNASRGPATFASEPISQIARAMGIHSVVLEENGNLSILDSLAASAGAPVLIEVKCSPPSGLPHY